MLPYNIVSHWLIPYPEWSLRFGASSSWVMAGSCPAVRVYSDSWGLFYQQRSAETRTWISNCIHSKVTPVWGDFIPDRKVHGANMGPIWGRQDPGGPHVCPMNFAIWDVFSSFPLHPPPQRLLPLTSKPFVPNLTYLNMSSGKCRPFCLCLNVLMSSQWFIFFLFSVLIAIGPSFFLWHGFSMPKYIHIILI